MQFISVWRTGVGVMLFQVRTRPALHIGAVRERILFIKLGVH